METPNKVLLKIGPVDLKLATTDPPEYAKALGAKLDGQVRDFLDANPCMTPVQAIALAAIGALDEAKKASDSADNLRGLLKAYLEDINKYRSAADEAKKEAERLRAQLSEKG